MKEWFLRLNHKLLPMFSYLSSNRGPSIELTLTLKLLKQYCALQDFLVFLLLVELRFP